MTGEHRRQDDRNHNEVMKKLEAHGAVLANVDKRVAVIEAHEAATAEILKALPSLEKRVRKNETAIAVNQVKSGVFGSITGALSGFLTTFIKMFASP